MTKHLAKEIQIVKLVIFTITFVVTFCQSWACAHDNCDSTWAKTVGRGRKQKTTLELSKTDPT